MNSLSTPNVLPRLLKKEIRLQVDEDVLDWFKSQEIGYKKLMRAVLRDYVDEQKAK